MSGDDGQRLDGLEARFAWQEQTLAALGDQVYGQERRLARLEALLKQVAGQLKELSAGKEGLPPQERPPHY